MIRNKFRNLLIFFVSYLWFNSFSRAILPTHFLKEGLSLRQMALGYLFTFISALCLLALIRRMTARLSWRIGIAASLLYIVLIMQIRTPLQFYLASFFGGFHLVFFWVFYNTAHFQYTPQEKTGRNSALMFSFFPVINVIAPTLAGYFAQWNITLVWVLSSLFFLIPIALISRQEDFAIRYTLREALDAIKSTRVFIILQGIWEAVIIAIIPIHTLHFIKTPLYYGAFIAYLALVSIVANIILGKYTDKIQKRVVFLYPITMLLAGTTFVFPFVTRDIIPWILAAGMIQFLIPSFWNITTAMVVDTRPNLHLAIPGREFSLALGRVVGLFLTFISFSVEKTPYYIFLLLGSVMLLYPLRLFWITRIKKTYSYL